MASSGSRRPLLPGRGVLLAAEFLQAAGLDEASVVDMVEHGDVDGLIDQQGRLFGLFDDALPSADDLRARGHVVNEAYDPELLGSRQVMDRAEVTSDQGDAIPTWSMQWPR